jgi:hypothetical protein
MARRKLLGVSARWVRRQAGTTVCTIPEADEGCSTINARHLPRIDGVA